LIVSYSKVHEHAAGPLKRAIKALEYTGPASPFLAKMQRGAEDATAAVQGQWLAANGRLPCG